DGVQVDRSIPAARAGRLGGTLSAAAPGAECDPGEDRDRAARRAPAAPAVGRQEAAGAPASTRAALESARSVDGVRHSEAAWAGPDPTASTSDRASRQADEPDPGAERRVERRLQGTVP